MARPAEVVLIAGPSHVVRWGQHVRDGVVDTPLPWDRFIGRGGAPIWLESMLRKTSGIADAEGRIVVLVGDFRFGNGILLEDPVPPGNLVNGFTGITPNVMTPEQGQTMLNRGLAGMRAWHEAFGARTSYVLWDDFGRQVHDRLVGRHVADDTYQHPAFNYDEIDEALPDLDIIDLAPLLRLPMHEVQRLFIDGINHPSQVGYLLLNGLIFDGLDAEAAYARAVATVETELLRLASGLSRSAGRKVLLTGRSIWLDTLNRYVGAKGTKRLAEAGLILAPLNRASTQREPAKKLEGMDLAQCAVVVVSAGEPDLSVDLARAFRTESSLWEDATAVVWEQAAEKTIRKRGETPAFSQHNLNLPMRVDAIIPTLDASEIELGRAGMPSWTGITGLLRRAADEEWWRPVSEKEPWRIEKEVLITRNGVAFLVGGNHQPLKYSTGELNPSTQSLRTFSDNIEARSQHTDARKISYAHVVFPDKQSVLVHEFPIHPVVRLGETYLNQVSDDAAARMLYPADDLRAVEGACMPLDSHLSDIGSLAVLREMLNAIGADPSHALTMIEQRIAKPRRWPGDLGGKLDPPLFQEVLTLAPDWELVELNSGGGFNDGMIDILFSPNAPINKTVLLFGDSFFRMMLKHLSGVFSRVICLRTRFYHPEMVELIEPDIVFTGNAERYLAQVDSDKDAIPFMLYRPVRGIVEQFDPDFLEAWRSVTSPRAGRSTTYFEDHGVGRKIDSMLGMPSETESMETKRERIE